MCDNPTDILLDDPRPTDPHTWYIHSYRETMLALELLAAHRGRETARRQGLRAIGQMRKASEDPTRWDLARCGGTASALRPNGICRSASLARSVAASARCKVRPVWREPTAPQEMLTFHWLGDEITGAEPCGDYLKPFPKQCGSFLDNQ